MTSKDNIKTTPTIDRLRQTGHSCILGAPILLEEAKAVGVEPSPRLKAAQLSPSYIKQLQTRINRSEALPQSIRED